MKHLFALLSFIVLPGYSASLYVDTDHVSASDTNPGSEASPWKTIQKAASTAVAGDTVTIKAGEYNEFVVFANSGSDGNPIVFTGERGGGGEWLTILDPSTPASTGWVAAPEIGTGVYKRTDISFMTRELTIGNKRVAFVYSMGDISGSVANAYSGSGLTTGAHFLASPGDTNVTQVTTTKVVALWDGVEALWGVSGTTSDNILYLRLRDGSDPNGLNIRVAPNKEASVSTDVIKPAMILDSISYVTVRNLHIRGGFSGLRILNSGGHHNIVDNNYISGGYSRILVASSAHSNLVRNNTLVGSYYGLLNPGAWGGNDEAYSYTVRANLYLVSKFLMGTSESFEVGVYLQNAGVSNVISGNYIGNGLGSGLSLVATLAAPTVGTIVSGNIIEGHPSVGMSFQQGQRGTQVYGNRFLDSNINLRFNHWKQIGETDRSAYVYRNESWLPNVVGDHIFIHFYDTAETYIPEFWVYHNSFSGGKNGLSVGLPLAYYDTTPLYNLRIANNIFSGMANWIGNVGVDFWDAGMIGAFDYNMLTPPYLTYPSAELPLWAGANNIIADAAEWVSSDKTLTLLSTSDAVDAGLNIASAFTLQGASHDALPFSGAQIGSAWDIGAFEYGAPSRATNLNVGTLRGR